MKSEYPLLEKLYYKNKQQYETEYLNRFNSVSSIKFNIDINQYQAFIITTPEIINQIYQINNVNNQINKLINTLPKTALNQYIKKCLVEEIVLTNEIEGVISTKKDVSETLENIKISDRHKRLQGLVNKYLKLNSNEKLSIRNCYDIRDIYTDLLWEEILKDNSKNLPDGVYFRKSGVSVLSKFGKVIHEGITPEREINRKMTQALDILNDEKINILIRIAVFHYLFGYIHPFYDGNGRVNRFISSYLLSNNLNILTGYRFAYTIKENITAYYNSFKTANEPKNKGDVTYFVIIYFDIIIQMLEILYSSLSEKAELIDYYYTISQRLSNGNDDNKNIIFILFQETLFGNDGISINDLANESNISEYKINQLILELGDLNIIRKVKLGEKYLYSFNLEAVQNLNQSLSEFYERK